MCCGGLISSTRLQNWDYGWDALYYITICTANRECHFGEIAKGEIKLSNIGVLADVFWHEIKNHANNVELDAFVVMPIHVHGIIILNGFDFAWQSRFNDHIIRDYKSHQRIRNYIIDNPKNWDNDKFYK